MSSNETNWIRRTGIDVGEAPITGTTDISAGLRVKSGLSNAALLLQPTFDTLQVGQLGEKAQIWWYGANGERFAAIGPHAGTHDHFSVYTKGDSVGDGDTALVKRLDIDFGTTADSNADVKFQSVKEFSIVNTGGIPLVGIGTLVPTDQLTVTADTVACNVLFESDAGVSIVKIDSGAGFDPQLLLRENGSSKWLIHSDASLSGKFKVLDYASSARITIFPNGELIINEAEGDLDFRVAAVGETNALFVDGADGKVSVAGNRVVGAGTQSTTLGAAATTLVADQKFIVLTGDAGSNTIATITGDMAFAGNEITILFVDALVTITDTDAHTANTVDLSAAFTSADDTILKLVYDGTSWYEVSRSVN